MSKTQNSSRHVDMSGKVCLVTGANTGIGKVTALELARMGAHVVLTTRSQALGEEVAAEIRTTTGSKKVESLALELGDLAAVEKSADAFLARGLPLHVLINNAGVAGQRGITVDGFELQFGVNHLGPFLFTTKLLDLLRASAPARIVNVSSRAHHDTKQGIDYAAVRLSTRSLAALPEYSVSKLANVWFTKELARRLAGSGVTTYALHPGVVGTDVWRRIPSPVAWLMKRFMLTPEQGAQTTLYCATAPEVGADSGLYYDKCQEKRPSRIAGDVAMAEELWRRSEEFIAAALHRTPGS